MAIKVPKCRPGPSEIAELFSYLNLPTHPNVLPFLGLCTDWRAPPETTGHAVEASHHGADGISAARSRSTSAASAPGSVPERTLCLVTEMQQCSLRELALSLPPWRAHMSADDPRDPLLLLQLVRQMAAGLAHFHACRHIHRDVSLRNFLLSRSNTVLLCDFGLARLLEPHEEQQSHAAAASDAAPAQSSSLPLRWLAPESLLSQRFSSASDCWSFGVACWELVRQKRALPHPYAGVSNVREVVALVCTGEIALHFRDDEEEEDDSSADNLDAEGPERPRIAAQAADDASSGSQCSVALSALLRRCLSVTPSKRPSMPAVVAAVDKLIRQWYPEHAATHSAAAGEEQTAPAVTRGGAPNSPPISPHAMSAPPAASEAPPAQA